MDDRQLYGQILGLSKPWRVESVELDQGAGEIRVRVEKEGDRAPCPQCAAECSIRDRRERRWRHLDTCQFQTILVARVPRAECREHGVHQMRVPWAEEGSRFTALFEALVLDWLRVGPSINGLAQQLGLSWDQVDGILQRGVARGLARRELEWPVDLAVDETSFRRRHAYVTVVSEGSRVLHAAPGRTKEALSCFYSSLPPEALAQLRSVSMDMWRPFISATIAAVPDAGQKIAFDRYHVAALLNKAVDRVRRQERVDLLSQGDTSLTRTRFLWLKNPDSLSEQEDQRFDAVRKQAVRTARAWGFKETARFLWRFSDRPTARFWWRRWIAWALRSRIRPIQDAARTVRRYLDGIVNAAVLKVTNASAEGLNARIQILKKNARGFRNLQRFQNLIYFHFGGLDVTPEPLAG